MTGNYNDSPPATAVRDAEAAARAAAASLEPMLAAANAAIAALEQSNRVSNRSLMNVIGSVTATSITRHADLLADALVDDMAGEIAESLAVEEEAETLAQQFVDEGDFLTDLLSRVQELDQREGETRQELIGRARRREAHHLAASLPLGLLSQGFCEGDAIGDNNMQLGANQPIAEHPSAASFAPYSGASFPIHVTQLLERSPIAPALVDSVLLQRQAFLQQRERQDAALAESGMSTTAMVEWLADEISRELAGQVGAEVLEVVDDCASLLTDLAVAPPSGASQAVSVR